jgi:hypothetical protein
VGELYEMEAARSCRRKAYQRASYGVWLALIGYNAIRRSWEGFSFHWGTSQGRKRTHGLLIGLYGILQGCSEYPSIRLAHPVFLAGPATTADHPFGTPALSSLIVSGYAVGVGTGSLPISSSSHRR